MKFKTYLDEILLESRIDYILDKQGDKVWEAYEKDHGRGKPKLKTPHEVLTALSGMAKHLSQKYLQWLVTRYLKQEFSLEDSGKIESVLTKFQKLHAHLEKKDLNSYSFNDLSMTLDKISRKQDQYLPDKTHRELNPEIENEFFANKEAKLFYKGGGIEVVIPKSTAASQFFGSDTDWCTAYKNNCRYEDYAKQGLLYIVLTDDRRKFQFYFKRKSQQFMDKKDRPIEDWKKLTADYPALYDAFEKLAIQRGFLPLIRKPDEASFLSAIKNDPESVIDYLADHEVKPSDKVQVELINYSFSTITRHPEIFDADKILLSPNAGNIISWFNAVKKQRAENLITIDFFEKLYAWFLKHKYQTNDTIKFLFEIEPKFVKWIKDLPEEKIQKLCEVDSDLLSTFEDRLSEKYKIELLDKNPDDLKYFKNPTAKMKNQAKWAEDRIKRQRRGF